MPVMNQTLPSGSTLEREPSAAGSDQAREDIEHGVTRRQYEVL